MAESDTGGGVHEVSFPCAQHEGREKDRLAVQGLKVILERINSRAEGGQRHCGYLKPAAEDRIIFISPMGT